MKSRPRHPFALKSFHSAHSLPIPVCRMESSRFLPVASKGPQDLALPTLLSPSSRALFPPNPTFTALTTQVTLGAWTHRRSPSCHCPTPCSSWHTLARPPS